MEDTSLEDFLGDAADGDGGADERREPPSDREDGNGADEEHGRVDPATVEPAATTFAWGEGVCAVCGEQATERWGRTDDEDGDGDGPTGADASGGLVCAACKGW
jgi:hypothetical protein